MDDLSGLLVEGFGFRPRDRAPMAASKSRAALKSSAPPPMPPPSIPPPSSISPFPPLVDGLEGIFAASGTRRQSSSVLDDDFFGGLSSASSSSGAKSNVYDDIFGSFTSAPGNYPGADASGDLLGGFSGGSIDKGNGAGGDLDGDAAFEELIPGFGGSSPTRESEANHRKPSAYGESMSNMQKDPFIDMDPTISASHSPVEELDILSETLKSDKASPALSSDNSIFDEFQGSVPIFASDVKTKIKPAKVEDRKNIMHTSGSNVLDESSVIDFMFPEAKLQGDPLVDLLTKPSHPSKLTNASEVHAAPMKFSQQRNSLNNVGADDIWFSVSETSAFGQSSVPQSNIRKAASSPNILDDWNSLFAAPSSEAFQEIDGEPEERRKARWERHHRTLQRAAKALDEKNERDIQMERENAERHRIAERLDVDIKRWAAGKEGNLRALLSSLHDVLWPECGWQRVTLTDLITSASVKKVYRKASLCIHPDKVQQKGANLQQKYTAEKVFDLLKEAWKKFNVEELS